LGTRVTNAVRTSDLGNVEDRTARE
jgi:hypothetical protein